MAAQEGIERGQLGIVEKWRAHVVVVEVGRGTPPVLPYGVEPLAQHGRQRAGNGSLVELGAQQAGTQQLGPRAAHVGARVGHVVDQGHAAIHHERVAGTHPGLDAAQHAVDHSRARGCGVDAGHPRVVHRRRLLPHRALVEVDIARNQLEGAHQCKDREQVAAVVVDPQRGGYRQGQQCDQRAAVVGIAVAAHGKHQRRVETRPGRHALLRVAHDDDIDAARHGKYPHRPHDVDAQGEPHHEHDAGQAQQPPERPQLNPVAHLDVEPGHQAVFHAHPQLGLEEAQLRHEQECRRVGRGALLAGGQGVQVGHVVEENALVPQPPHEGRHDAHACHCAPQACEHEPATVPAAVHCGQEHEQPQGQHIGHPREDVDAHHQARQRHEPGVAAHQALAQQHRCSHPQHDGQQVVAQRDGDEDIGESCHHQGQYHARGPEERAQVQKGQPHAAHDDDNTCKAHAQQPHAREEMQQRAAHQAAQVVHEVVLHRAGCIEDAGIEGHVKPAVAHVEAKHGAHREIGRHYEGGYSHPQAAAGIYLACQRAGCRFHCVCVCIVQCPTAGAGAKVVKKQQQNKRPMSS